MFCKIFSFQRKKQSVHLTLRYISVRFPFCRLYWLYIVKMIDFAAGDAARYAAQRSRDNPDFRAQVEACDCTRHNAAERAAGFAGHWGSQFVCLQDAGHINVASGHHDWVEGRELLENWARSLR